MMLCYTTSNRVTLPLNQHTDACQTATRGLFELLLNLTGEQDWRVFSYSGRVVLLKLLAEARRIRGVHGGAVDWVMETARACATLLKDAEYISGAEAEVLVHSAECMVAEMRRRVEDVANLSVEDIGLFGRPQNCLRLMTMHRAKGREFDAVAVVDLHDDKVPHFTAHGDPYKEAEARRLLYVATTRARKVLMYITDDSRHRNEPSRFLGANGLNVLPRRYW